MDFIQNPLNVFSTYSYNVALYQVHPRDLGELDRNLTPGSFISGGQSDARAILIADNSQESRYNITNVEQVFSLGYGQVRTAFANKFDITIQEPNGTTFLESLVLSARRLGIENHVQARYIMEITFNGRNENNRPEKYRDKFYYPVVILNTSVQIDHGGSTYNISAVENSTNAYSYLENVIKDQITFEASTVGEFIEEFEKKMEDALRNRYLLDRNAAYPDKYEITFAEDISEWKEWKFQQAGDSLDVTGVSLMENGSLHFVIPNGSNITDVIGMALQCTEEYKKIPTLDGGFARADGSGKPATSDLSKLKLFYKVIGDVKYGKFDPLRNDYVKTLSYKVVKYIMPDAIIDSTEYTKSITDVNVQKRRLQNLVDAGLLRKRYDYLYTGMNTEVMSLDIRLDNTYYIISVIGNGQLGDSNKDTSAAGKETETLYGKISENKQDIAELADEIRALQRNLSSNSGSSSVTRVQPNRTSIEEESDTIKTIDRKQKKLDRLLSEQERLLEQYSTKDYAKTDALSQYSERKDRKVDLPIRFASDIVDDSDVYGVENDRTGGTLQFGAVKANLEQSGDMLTIELGIKGDPYWMGKPNSFYRNITQQTDTADYEMGSNMFFLNVKFPVEEDSNGRRKPGSEYSVTGIYRVINVINTFRNGLFMQYLKAVRDTSTNTSTVIDTLNEDE